MYRLAEKFHLFPISTWCDALWKARYHYFIQEGIMFQNMNVWMLTFTKYGTFTNVLMKSTHPQTKWFYRGSHKVWWTIVWHSPWSKLHCLCSAVDLPFSGGPVRPQIVERRGFTSLFFLCSVSLFLHPCCLSKDTSSSLAYCRSSLNRPLFQSL